MSDYYTESQMQRIEQAAYDGAMLEAGKEWERQRGEFGATEAELQSRIAELEEAQRWIPVGERLPEENQQILSTDGKEFYLDCYARWEGKDNPPCFYDRLFYGLSPIGCHFPSCRR